MYKGTCHLRLASGVDKYVEQIERAGQPMAAPAADRPEYGMREAAVQDPDGNDIYIAQELRSPTASSAERVVLEDAARIGDAELPADRAAFVGRRTNLWRSDETRQRSSLRVSRTSVRAPVALRA